MARDLGLEEIVRDELGALRNLTEKAMFGGWAWLLDGHLLCGARDTGLLVRLGKGNDAWALAVKGVEPMIMRGRALEGWIRADERAYGDDHVRRKLVTSAVRFVRSLPEK